MLLAEITNFKFQSNERTVLKNVRLVVSTGKVCCLIGPSGVGKTTLLKILMGFLPIEEAGKVKYLLENNVLSPDGARERGVVGMMAQSSMLTPWNTIEENIFLPHRLNKKLKKPGYSTLEGLVQKLGMEISVLKKYPHQLSYGMQQRINFVRTVVYCPAFVFLDELFSGLDTVNCDKLQLEICRYIKENNVCCFLTTHNIDRAIKIADSLYVHKWTGEIVELSSPYKRDIVVSHLENEKQ